MTQPPASTLSPVFPAPSTVARGCRPTIPAGLGSSAPVGYSADLAMSPSTTERFATFAAALIAGSCRFGGPSGDPTLPLDGAAGAVGTGGQAGQAGSGQAGDAGSGQAGRGGSSGASGEGGSSGASGGQGGGNSGGAAG